MKFQNWKIIIGAAAVMAALPAQASELDMLREQVEKLTQTVKELQQQVVQLQQRDPAPLQAAQNSQPAATDPITASTTGPIDTSILDDPAAAAWSPSDPIRVIGNNQAYMNISFDGLFAAAASSAPDLQTFELGGHDPNQRGFTVQNLEVTFDGAVDPYFKGQANIILQIDANGETVVEAEEAFLQTTSLPYNLELKGGQYFTAFGRLNPQHPHAWDFADQPVVNGIFLGPDGLRNPGAQISWLLPTPWYSVLLASVQNSQGETALSFRNRGDDDMFMGRATLDRGVSGMGDMLYSTRWENSVDLDDEQTVVLGTSAAFGPNDTGTDTSTQIYGADLFYKWKSSCAQGGYPFVKWQSEAMVRRYEAGDDPVNLLPAETFHDWGMYSQVVWGFARGWTAGVRGDLLCMQGSNVTSDIQRANRWRVAPALTWYPSEFSKIRLQYNHDEIGSSFLLERRHADSVFLQFEFLLGAHGAHKF